MYSSRLSSSRTMLRHLRRGYPHIRTMSTKSPIIQLSKRPENWKDTAPAPLPNTVTFAAQNDLKRLPVPELDNTLSLLKETLRPIAHTAQESAAVERKVDEFAKTPGPELQKRLQERYKNTRHWLEQWWDDGGYLGYRDSVVVNVSYYYGFGPQPSHLPHTPAGRAACIARAAMLFRQKLKRGEIKPDVIKDGPFCMDTYRWMFDCCRVPGPEGLDWSVTYAKEGEIGDSGHIIVFRRNRPWRVETTENGRILSVEEIQRQIQFIYDNTDNTYPGVGVLTSNNRDVWAKDYNELASTPNNSAILHEIQSAAFTISLDSDSPSDPVSFSRGLWHGTYTPSTGPTGLQNRWVDKPTEFIVYDNAEAGIMGEHSIMDGTPTVRLCDDILDWLADPKFDSGSGSYSAKPIPLDWDISPATERAIEEANKAASELVSGQELGFFKTPYGKAAIKSFGVSPDSWAQMIIQLAYRRLIGDKKNRKGGTYEAATTRRFFKGRTETIRVVSAESDAWVESMDDPSKSIHDRKALFDKATKKHGELARRSGTAQGVDRHMLGLRKLLQPGESTPALFDDPVFKRSSYWVLSTSAIFSKHFVVYGWGEVVPDGFGVAYMTGFDDYLMYTITSRKEMPNAQFCTELQRAAKDLYDLHAALQQANTSKKALL